MVRGGRRWTVYLDGGPEMAPKPPHVRSAAAEPWRCSGVVGIVRGPEMAPKPPHVRSGPAEPWRCLGVVGVRARPGDGPQAPTRAQRPGGAVALLWARQPRQTHQAKRATMTAATATWAAAPMTIPTSVPSPARTLSPSGRARESSPRIAPATGPATRPIGAVNRPTTR